MERTHGPRRSSCLRFQLFSVEMGSPETTLRELRSGNPAPIANVTSNRVRILLTIYISSFGRFAALSRPTRDAAPWWKLQPSVNDWKNLVILIRGAEAFWSPAVCLVHDVDIHGRPRLAILQGVG